MQGKHIKYDGDEIPDDHSTVSSASMAAEKEELNFLREQLEDLHRQLSEKDELLKEVEAAKSKISAMQSQVDELKQFANEKVSLTKSSESQLNDAKVFLFLVLYLSKFMCFCMLLIYYAVLNNCYAC